MNEIRYDLHSNDKYFWLRSWKAIGCQNSIDLNLCGYCDGCPYQYTGDDLRQHDIFLKLRYADER